MLTTDLALRADPAYEKISRRFHENPDEFALAFAKAWYKLLHRDMGPVSRYLGPWVPEPQLWQDPVPAVDHELIGDEDVAALKATLLDSGLTVSQLASTAWASAASFRGTDNRGGANGARIRLEPQRSWEVNEPAELAKVLQVLEQVQQEFNGAQSGGKQVSLADLIVLGGCAAVEQAARNAGHEVTVPFRPGRTDASQEQTDVDSFAVLEPRADGFRNYVRSGVKLTPETLLVERSYMLNLNAPEMTVLVGGMRALGTNFGGSDHGVLTDRPGALTNDFFVNLLAAGAEWKASESTEGVYEIRDVASGELKWTATAVDLVFGANSQLRAISEVYASDDAQEKFVERLRGRVGRRSWSSTGSTCAEATSRCTSSVASGGGAPPATNPRPARAISCLGVLPAAALGDDETVAVAHPDLDVRALVRVPGLGVAVPGACHVKNATWARAALVPVVRFDGEPVLLRVAGDDPVPVVIPAHRPPRGDDGLVGAGRGSRRPGDVADTCQHQAGKEETRSLCNGPHAAPSVCSRRSRSQAQQWRRSEDAPYPEIRDVKETCRGLRLARRPGACQAALTVQCVCTCGPALPREPDPHEPARLAENQHVQGAATADLQVHR